MTTFVMQAKENYDPTRAAQADGGSFPTGTFVDTHMIGLGYDAAARELVYQVNIMRSGTNDTGVPLWDGETKVDIGGSYNVVTSFNFHLARKNIDTGLVTFYDGYSPTKTVPAGIGPGGGGGVSDGTWQRYVSDAQVEWTYPVLSDPRTHDGWVHTQSCKLWVFRTADSYALAISPLIPTIDETAALMARAMTEDWVYAIEVSDNGGGGPGAKLHMVPRQNTAAEIAADHLLAYATFNFPAYFTYDYEIYYVPTVDKSDDLWVFASPQSGATDFRLFKFTKPSAFLYPTPPADGGISDVTPWTSTTGPNTPLVGQTLFSESIQRIAAMFSPGRTQLNMLSVAFADDFAVYDYANVSVYHTWYKTADASWGSAKIASGYMTSDFTVTSDPTAAAFALTGQIHATNLYLDADAYYSDADLTSRWFAFHAYAVSGGVVDSGDERVLLVKLTWVDGAAPTVAQVVDEAGTWDAAYTDYASAIQANNPSASSARVVAQSIQANDLHYDLGVDCGIYDATSNAFWFSGMTSDVGTNNNMFWLDAAFIARHATTGPGGTLAQPPLMKLFFTSPIPPPPGPAFRSMVWSTIGFPTL